MTCPTSPTALEVWASLSWRQRDELSTAFQYGAHGVGPRELTWTSLARRGLAAWSDDLGRWELTPLGKHVAHPPVCFLDQDGVTAHVLDDPDATALDRLNEAAVRRLNRIVDATGAWFVSSSTWRLGQKPEDAARTITGWLRAKGFTGQVVSATPVLGPGRRGQEIQAWLDRQGTQPRAFAILDDCEPMGDLTHRTVYTDYDRLLTDPDVDRVIELLSPPERVERTRGTKPAAPAGVST